MCRAWSALGVGAKLKRTEADLLVAVGLYARFIVLPHWNAVPQEKLGPNIPLVHYTDTGHPVIACTHRARSLADTKLLPVL